MKSITTYIITIFLFLSFENLYGQAIITKNGSTPFGTDSVAVLTLGKHRGKVTWQQSFDNKNWLSSTLTGKDSIEVMLGFKAKYRAKIEDGNCDPVYSDTISVTVADSVKTVYANALHFSAYPYEVEEIVTFIKQSDRIVCEKINGEYVWQGDIILTQNQIENLLGIKGAGHGLLFGCNRLWPNGIIYFDYSKITNPFLSENIKKAINHWRANTPLKFEERKTEPNYIEFIQSSEDNKGSSFVGMIEGAQQIWLGGKSEKGTVIHEIGHAVGLVHEQSRPDWAEYIKIVWENLYNNPETRENYSSNITTAGNGLFDFESIMLYSGTMRHFAVDKSKPTIINLSDGFAVDPQINELTKGDIKMVKLLYQDIRLGLIYPENSTITSTSIPLAAIAECNVDHVISDKGFCINEKGEPTIDEFSVSFGSLCGSFYQTANDLKPETYYWVRAYAKTNTGTYYSNEYRIKTLPKDPDILLKPIADFVPSNYFPVVGESVQFTDKSTNNPTSWFWNFGDNLGASQTQNPSYTFTKFGSFTVSLAVSNKDGGSTKTILIKVLEAGIAPVTDFTVSNSQPQKGENIQFTDKSTNIPTSWLWNFGDGTTSTIQNPLKSYSAAGTYSISLKATNSYGANIKVTNLTVSETGIAPVADFTVSNAQPKKGESIQFTDKSTNIPTSWLWNFGDGTTSTIQNPSKSYSTAGTYSISLKATNSYGSNTKVTNLTVSETGIAPITDFTVSNTQPKKGESIQFTDKSTNIPTSWLWNFGDGTTSTTQNPLKSYSAAGTYSISLKATNSYGTNTKILNLTVSETGIAPIADFTVSNSQPQKGESIQFTDKSTNIPTSWLWNFGDGTTSTVQNPSKMYSVTGNFTISLKATNSYGENTKTVSNYITVTEPATLPTVTTWGVESLTQTSVKSGGTVTTDGGSPVTARGVCWNTTGNPTPSENKTVDGTGTGVFTSTVTPLVAGTTYFLRAYATNSIGTSYGSVMPFSIKKEEFTGTFTDSRDGNVYKWVKIGNQTWMAENLKATIFNDETPIPNITDENSWSDLTNEAFCWYNNDATNNRSTYGALYNWYAVSTGKLCPKGWHAPSYDEFNILYDYLYDNGYKYDEGARVALAKPLSSQANWNYSGSIGTPGNDPNTNNKSGFSALPGGYRGGYPDFQGLGLNGNWWTSTEMSNSSAAMKYTIYNNDRAVIRSSTYKILGYSVRCLKD